MKLECSLQIEEIVKEHARLIRRCEYTSAKALIYDALISCYTQSTLSFDVAVLLDELALDCKELEQFQEACLYLTQSLAIKQLLFGPEHPEVLTAQTRAACWKENELSDEQKLHSSLNEVCRKLSESAESKIESEVTSNASPECRVVRCLVIAKNPPSKYFRGRGKSAYVVACEDEQLGVVSTSEHLELGSEIDAKPLRVFFGTLLLRYLNRVAADVKVADGARA